MTSSFRRKVVFFDCVTHFGGAQRSTLTLCRDLSRFFDVVIVDGYGACPEFLEAIAMAGLPCRVVLPEARHYYIGAQGRIFRRLWRVMRQLPELWELRRRLQALLTEIRPDLVWVNDAKPLMFLTRAGRRADLPVVLYARGWFRKCQTPLINRWLIRRAHLILAISSPTAEAMRQWGIDPGRIRIAPTGVDCDAVVRDAAAGSQPLPGGDKPFRMVLPAQLIRTKGQHTAVEAARILKDRGRDFAIWLAGDVKMGVGDEYVRHVESLIRELEVDKNVFLVGFRSDIRAMMAEADAVILPTHTEGFPRTVWEAMSLGRPVITTPVGGIPDLISDGETGLLVPVEDPFALAGAVEKLMDDPSLGTRLGAAGRDHVRRTFTLERQVEAVQSAFQELISRHETR